MTGNKFQRLSFASVGVAVAVVAVGVARSDDGMDRADYQNQFRVRAADFDRVPLPIHRPPRGATLMASQQQGVDIDTEQIEFAYSGFTIKVCSVDRSKSTFDPCETSGAQVLRTVTDRSWITTFTVSTKFGGPPSGSAAEQVAEHFRTSELAPRPQWIDPYTNDKIKEMFG